MNPLEAAGPLFLLFYMLLMIGAFLSLRLLRRTLENGSVPRLKYDEADAYLLAYLRDGRDGAIRASTLALCDRGLLRVEGERVLATAESATAARPLEQAILRACSLARPGVELERLGSVQRACRALRGELETLGFLPGAKQVAVRFALYLLVVAVLLGVGWAKLARAAATGHHNTGLLSALMVITPLVFPFALLARTTARGERALIDLRELFTGLRVRTASIPRGGATNELALLIGLFGLTSLSGQHFEDAKTLFPGAVAAEMRKHGAGHYDGRGASGGSSCGSGCGGGSSGGGCGSGCGGGCGGCGS